MFLITYFNFLFVSEGVVAIPSAVFGTMLGGAAVKMCNLKFIGVLRVCVFTTIASAVFASCFLIKCLDDNVAGVTIPYFEE